MRFLHFVFDEKFIDTVMEQFDRAGIGSHRYCYTGPRWHRIAKIRQADRVERCSGRGALRRMLAAGDYDALLIHNLYALDLTLLAAVPEQVRVVWLSWGADLYDNHRYSPRVRDLIGLPLYDGETSRLLAELERRPRRRLRNLAVNGGKLLLGGPRFFLSQRAFDAALERIDRVATVVPDEYEVLVRRACRRSRPLNFSYGFPGGYNFPAEEVGGWRPPERAGGILVGHAATPTMNHLDAFARIRQLAPDRELVVPLSYGDADYGAAVAARGEAEFGGRVRLLRRFLPLAEYNRLLRGCTHAVFQTRRQQAVGNLLMLLWNGTRVFLPEDSLMFRYFNRIGLRVESLERATAADFAAPFDAAAVRELRETLLRYYSEAAIMAKIIALPSVLAD